ncbi:hypothetical protein FNV43_RR11255 [Rhamnella rubrinervis]|uniref:Uncharacterized protein n=1 Tax=Rhamnella rubrinervis TaxID=2594499 RepID=A0A8K0MHG3_9ROSA|nr:hypothetical protein FNV43_RR11255 [Rhamnella rubrinervis]
MATMHGISQGPCDATMRLLLTSLTRNRVRDVVTRRLMRVFIANRISLKEMPKTLNSDHEPQSDAYKLNTPFFKMVLGKYLKFRAQIKDGETILDIGCGWRSLRLYIAEKYNNCKLTGITDSTSQKACVDEQRW